MLLELAVRRGELEHKTYDIDSEYTRGVDSKIKLIFTQFDLIIMML